MSDAYWIENINLILIQLYLSWKFDCWLRWFTFERCQMCWCRIIKLSTVSSTPLILIWKRNSSGKWRKSAHASTPNDHQSILLLLSFPNLFLRVSLSSCVCCCFKSAVPAYKPEGCDCKLDFGGPFITTVILAAVTILVSILSSCYFTGRSEWFSPYRKTAAQEVEIQMSAL